MDSSNDKFSTSPLVIASKKANWVYEGFLAQVPSTTVLLAQALSSIVHGYNSYKALPASTELSYSCLKSPTSSLRIANFIKQRIFKKPFLAYGHDCIFKELASEHKGDLSVVCGDKVHLNNVNFKGTGSKNLVIICNGASLENVEIKLDGLGLVIIGADSTLHECRFDTGSNNGSDCTLFKTLLTFPHEEISHVSITSILRRKKHALDITKNSNKKIKFENLDIADLFSTALSGKYCEDLRNIEDTKEFSQKLNAKDELIHSFRSIHNSLFSHFVNTSPMMKVKVACLMMQRNETSLLKPWVSYYQSLFGKENIYIFDNGSDDKEVINYLSYLRDECSFNVDFSHQSSADFKRKGVIFRKFIEELQCLEHYDIFIPIDCDEFLGVLNHEGDYFDLQSDNIISHLNSLKYEQNALKIKRFFNNFPSSSSKFYRQNGEKTLFTANTINKLDRGYHKGESINGKETKTKLTYLHFHNKPLEELKRHSYNKLAPFFNIEDPSVLDELINNNNRLAKNLIETSEGYSKRFSGKPEILSEELKLILEELGTKIEV